MTSSLIHSRGIGLEERGEAAGKNGSKHLCIVLFVTRAPCGHFSAPEWWVTTLSTSLLAFSIFHCSYLHSVYFFMINKLVQVRQVVPPLKQKGLCNQFKPRSNLDFVPGGFVQELFQFFLRHVTVALDLVRIRVQRYILLHEQDVVYFMFTPDPIRLGLVVNSGQVEDFLRSYLQPKHTSEPGARQNNSTARNCWELPAITILPHKLFLPSRIQLHCASS